MQQTTPRQESSEFRDFLPPPAVLFEFEPASWFESM